MKLSSHNEWDRLREVVVGTVEGMTVGLEFPPSQPVTPELLERASVIAKRAIPDWYRDEVGEDLEGLCRILREFGVVVHRPDPCPGERLFGTPDWQATGKDLYNVRDLHLVTGNTVIACPSPARCRYHEPDAFRGIWHRYLGEDFNWVTAPKPRLSGTYLTPYFVDGQEEVTEEEAMHRKLSAGRWETFHHLAEDEILFDAANVVRLGRDLIYLVSCTGNRRGAAWLQGFLGDAYRVHTTSTYRASHIDSTVVPLRPGLVLFNGVRVNPGNCPGILAKWDKIYFSDVAPLPPEEVVFQANVRDKIHGELLTMGVQTDLDHLCSPWLGLNVLSLDPRTVLVHDRQANVMRALERHGITPIPVRLRHCYTMLGGPHCCTLDTVRDGGLETHVD